LKIARHTSGKGYSFIYVEKSLQKGCDSSLLGLPKMLTKT
jgi:hypothetical protein